MKSEKTNVRRAAYYGAALGIPLLILRGLVFGERLPTDSAELIGFLIGGALGGAILFAGAATVRNLFVK